MRIKRDSLTFLVKRKLQGHCALLNHPQTLRGWHPQYLHMHLRQKITGPKCEHKECTLRIRAFWSEIGRTPGCLACETPGPVKSHTHECRSYQGAWNESRRKASAEEAKRGIVADPDARPLDPIGSSTDPEPKRTKTTPATDNENQTDQVDEDNFRATSHQLEAVDDGNVSKKAHEWQETFSTSVVRTKKKFDVTEDGRMQTWLLEQATKMP